MNKFFMVAVKHWTRLLRDVADVPPLQMLKVKLVRALSNLVCFNISLVYFNISLVISGLLY